MIYIPELPEVETLKLGLQKYIVGKTITDVEVRLKRIFTGDIKDIIGAKVIGVERFGKGLVINLDNDYSLAIHIKLTGQLVYKDTNDTKGTNGAKDTNGTSGTKVERVEVPNKFTHVIFKLKNNSSESNLYYNDIRQFGWIKVIPTQEVGMLSFFKDLGPEFPLVKKEGSLTIEKFKEILSKSKLAIKPLIMDQKKIAGIGNIYANDGLYLAKINPKRPANSLSSQEIETLYNSLLTVLKKGLQEGGASELTFVNVLGEKGNYQNYTLIYGKTGKACKNCGTKIIRTTLGGRGTFTCPVCQGD